MQYITSLVLITLIDPNREILCYYVSDICFCQRKVLMSKQFSVQEVGMYVIICKVWAVVSCDHKLKVILFLLGLLLI